MAAGAVGFLIVGAGRGGTSLLAGLLDCHSAITVGFEQFALEYLKGTALQEPPGAPATTAAAALRQRVRGFVDACRDEAGRFPGRLWGNKITTEQVLALEELYGADVAPSCSAADLLLREGLPGTKIVFILRDGRTCVKSKVDRTGQSLDAACRKWNYAANVYRYLRESHPNNITVKFEALVQQPLVVLEDVCGFLGVAVEPRMLAGTDNEKVPMEYRRKSFDLSRLQIPQIPARYLDLIKDNLRYCGYPL